MTFNPSNSLTAFLPTTQYFPDDDQHQMIITLTSSYSLIAQAVNLREIGQYSSVSNLNGQQWDNPSNAQAKRYAYRQVYRFGSIAAGATLTTPHGLTNVTIFTRISATCITNVVDYRSIPYVDVTDVTKSISIQADATNFYIANGAAAPDITSGLCVLEFLLN